ncbi:MAG: hypothetical protein A2Y28_03075 [Chlamydiae bacterium GWC2_50_10]|nr:MAG: hypothetical protein A2Y28_03075 [Chlamydiae bacterium GWC2_50_10]OGN58154.1 MAG: hypothetical protein A3D18_05915 [Chlamydiae bacterium RIFCSPHIGHO2_02_FULL_49_29]OGN62400.1 MAG: hypothetical protein A3E26_05095 [Chlamydiae bacterium RIFCSPHIGHO2_12_FULL_49_32]OGN67964.1 MAG: hypothetical protein A3I15_06420 [Chlamydiae bacterium RIFCSPLOWO2_02_FULL_49_12]OGN74645.1 MAG: hypothetical protein A3G30_00795 [Chlamydiae bacterium RIFCSPLOWO2_12_FULL_49_12]HCJ83898.1 hypothetical protein [P
MSHPIETLDFVTQATLEQQEASPEEQLKELLQTEKERADETHTLHLSKETVLRILTLLSQRQDIYDKDQKLLREMIHDLTNDLYNSKQAQAGLYVAFSLTGGAVGCCAFSGASSIGTMIQGFSTVSDHFYSASQMWKEVGKQLLFNDLNLEERGNETVHQALNRIMEAVQTQDSTYQRARTR